MTINKEIQDDKMKISLDGRLDTTTAPELEEVIRDSIKGIKDLEIDFSGISYISSAGLRVILSAQKIMNTQGSMKVTGVCESVMEIFEVTGFLDILTVE